MATLYELTAQARVLYELLQAEEIDEQTYRDTLEAMGTGEKVESYCQVIKQLSADSVMFNDELNRLKARKKSADNGVERMRGALLTFLKESGNNEVKAGTFTVSTAKTQVAKVIDEKKIPPEYLIPQPPMVDKMALKKALKEGAEIEGAELITNEGVRIR